MQAILAIKPPTGVRQLRHVLGMVQYYCDLWARRSNMLAPLTSLIGECSQTKSTKAKGTKKVPWHWDKVLTLTEIADAQHKDQELKTYFKKNAIMPQKDIGVHLIEDTKVLCKNGKVMIPTSLWHRAVSWYHLPEAI